MSPSTIVAAAAEQEVGRFGEVKRTVMVPCQLGLHLRVAALVVTMARKFQSDIQFCSNRLCVSAKSILGMLELSAVRGKRLSLVARGPDAQRAVQVLAELFESKEVLCKENLTSEQPHHHKEELMAEVTIQPLKNGPVLVKGPVQLLDAQGKPMTVQQGQPIALCRCGHSANKPFCDGSHQKAGFQAG